MPKLCGDGCHIICDSCQHYIDEYHDKDNKFSGEGVCNIDNRQVSATDGCNNFECFRIKLNNS